MTKLHQPLEEQFEISAPGSFCNFKRFEHLRVFQSGVSPPAATRTLLKNRKPLQLRFFFIKYLTTATAAALVLNATLPVTRLADYFHLLTNGFHLFPVGRRDPLCDLDPLRGLSIRISHFVGEYLSVNEPGSIAITACNLAGCAQRIVPENVSSKYAQELNPQLFLHSLKRLTPVGALSSKLIDKGDYIIRRQNARFCKVEFDTYRRF